HSQMLVLLKLPAIQQNHKETGFMNHGRTQSRRKVEKLHSKKPNLLYHDEAS
ncbi:hypothetical protein P7K49_034006, partial [Saguinus oedipus]